MDTDTVKLISTHPNYIMDRTKVIRGGGDGGGGNDMESRVTRLESDVDHIKQNSRESREDIRHISSELNDIKVSMALALQKLDGLSKLPTDDKMNVRFAEVMSKIAITTAETESKITKAKHEITLWIIGTPSILFTLYKIYTTMF